MSMVEVDQEQALEVLESGMNVFLTGKAGAGKTHVIKRFVQQTKKNVAITATTGIAALNIGGDTVHRFLGLGIATRPEDAGKIISSWEKKKKSSRSWDKEAWALLQNLDTLIIDEVSMLRRDQFDLIDAVLSNVLDNTAPFGGIQIILVGDFFQLPPVVTTYDKRRYPDLSAPYCFQSGLWRHGKFASICLNTNYRQSDGEFLDALDDVRQGECSEETNALMTGRVNKKFESDIKPIKLFSHKADVAEENLNCLKALGEDVLLSEAEYEGKEYDIKVLEKECPAEDRLLFCEGAQVMMLTNDPEGRWVNGSMGIVTSIDPIAIKLDNGIINPPTFTWERKVNKTRKIKGKNVVEQRVVAKMTQYPFKLAYATTIHKSQGLTLDYVDLDISKCFAPGQAYVALSRVRSIEGLILRGWNKNVIKADNAVKSFYRIIGS